MRTALLLVGTLPLLAQSGQKSSLRGRLIDDIYSQGTAKARIALTGGGLSGPIVVTSDERGNFSFSELTAGRYQINVEKAGYFTPTPQSVQVGGSPSADLGDIVLTRTRSISGVVKWSDGEPAAGVTVQVFPIVAGKPSYRGIATANYTDDRGAYRIRDLRPGRYVVVGSSSRLNLVDNPRPRVGLQVFYPGSDSATGSVNIDVRKTPEATDISFALRERPGVTVEGTVVPSAAFPAGTQVGISLSIPGIPVPGYGLRRMRAGDPFLFLDVPEGQYLITVSSPELVRGYEFIQVGKEPLRDVRVNMPESVPVTMRVEMEEPNGQRTSPIPGIAIRGQFDLLMSLGITGFGASRPGPAMSNGDLRATDIAPGATYSMSFSRLPTGSYVESVTQGKNEQHFGPFEFIANANPVRVLLKKDGGTISGSVRGEKGPVPQAFVVLAPKNRKATIRYMTASSDKDGNYQLSAIAPGDYELYAFDRNDEDSYLDEDYLRKYNSHVIAVTVQPNSANSLQPELTRVAGQ